MICPTCNEMNPESFLFCTNCGAELIPASDHERQGGAAQPSAAPRGAAPIASGSASTVGFVAQAPKPPGLPKPSPQPAASHKAVEAPFPDEAPVAATRTPFPGAVPGSSGGAPFPDEIPDSPQAPFPDDLPIESGGAPFPDDLPDENLVDPFPVSGPATAPFPDDLPDEIVETSPAAGNTLPAPFPADIPAQDSDTAKMPREPVGHVPFPDDLEPSLPGGVPGDPMPDRAPAPRAAAMPNLDAIAASPSPQNEAPSGSRKDTKVVPPMARPFVAKAPVVAAARTTCEMCGARIEAGRARCDQCGIPIKPSKAARAQGAEAQTRLIHIASDGRAEASYPVGVADTLFDCRSGQPCEPNAPGSDSVAVLRHRAGQATITAPPSMPGVFMRIAPRQPIAIEPGGHFKVGRQLLLFTANPAASPASWGTLSNITEGHIAQTHVLKGDGAVLGRESADIVFPDDPFASSTHLRIYPQNGRVYIVDLGSTNGSYVKIEGEHPLAAGAVLLIGPRLYRLDSAFA